MSWLGGKRIATEVLRQIDRGDDARIVVGFDAKLAARLAAAGARVTFVSDIERDVSRATTTAIALDELSSVGDDLDGAVVVGSAGRDDRQQVVEAFRQRVSRGAVVALVDRAQRGVSTQAALLGGLSRLTQSAIGRVVITCGRQSEARLPASLES